MSSRPQATGRMLVVTGKGGVGKTAAAAALGEALARAGRRVLLIEVDPRESLYQMFGGQPSGGEVVRVPLADEAGGQLSIQNVQPTHVIEQTVREHLRIDLISRRVLGNSVFQHFVESGPGLKEMAVLAHAMRALGHPLGGSTKDHPGKPVDIVILDAPATGHGVSLLAAPRLVAEVIQQGPFGRMARELTAFVSDPSRLGIVIVTRAEEMPARETVELVALLENRIARRPDLLVVNGLYPPLPDGVPDASRLGALAPVLSRWRERRTVNDQELRRLRGAWKGPMTELPLLPIDAGRELVSVLARRLSDALDVADAA